jgi:hypothetical protein
MSPRPTLRPRLPRNGLHPVACALALAVVTACAGEPTSPAAAPTPGPTVPADVADHAFLLTIDVATGQVTVRAPQQASRSAAAGAGGPSFSLLGTDAIALHAGNCVFTSIANNAKLKRCTMSLAIENRLSATDLVTSTSFPRPPAGAGIVVFPFTVGALGVTGGTAVPNASWDGAPANFFNDFSGCAAGKTSDCYRWESYASPIRAGATSAPTTVGFDVDKNANDVAVYLGVAADLRDNPIQTLVILPEPDNCSYHARADPNIHINPDHLSVGTVVDTRSLCSFELHDIPAGVEILSADLRVFQTETFGDVGRLDGVLVDHMDYGTLDLDFFEYTEPALTSLIGNFPIADHATFQTLDVAPEVTADLAASRVRSQYRLRVVQLDGASIGVRYAGPSSGVPPQLTITYRKF